MATGLALGRIVWAQVADANGISKLRPAVIVTPTEAITTEGVLDIVAVTSRVPDPLPDDHVMLPWHPRGHARTRLNRKCAAVCSWLAQIPASAVEDIAGMLPAATLLEILQKIAARETE